MTLETIQPCDHDWVAPADSPEATGATASSEGGRRRPAGRGAAAAALVLAGAVGGAAVTQQLVHPSTTTTAATPATGGVAAPFAPSFGGGAVQPLDPSGGVSAGSLSGAGPANADAIAGKVDPAIVDINTTIGYQNAQAAGTGIVLTSTGEILTNNHVISGATSISVTDVGNGHTYRATVVGYDRSRDIAVLQLEGASGLATADMATEVPKVGAGVVGIGNAGGAGGTPSYAAGIITATDQTITASDSSDGSSEQLTGLLETSADIVAGDSGGPLVNAQGEVVGLDTAASAGFRFSQASQAYAIPIASALQIAHQIEAGQAGTTVHIGPTAMLGVGVEPDSTRSGGPFGGTAAAGATVASVLDNGPAAAAGISAGDTVTAIDGTAVSDASDLTSVMLQQTPGQSVTVRYLDRFGQPHTTTVTLVTGPPQ